LQLRAGCVCGRAVIYVFLGGRLSFRAWWVALNKATTEDSVAKYVSRLTKSVSLLRLLHRGASARAKFTLRPEFSHFLASSSSFYKFLFLSKYFFRNLAYWPLVCFHLRATHIVCVRRVAERTPAKGGELMIGLTAVSGAATLADTGQTVNHKC
jgi:hypothetical protein